MKLTNAISSQMDLRWISDDAVTSQHDTISTMQCDAFTKARHLSVAEWRSMAVSNFSDWYRVKAKIHRTKLILHSLQFFYTLSYARHWLEFNNIIIIYLPMRPMDKVDKLN